MPRAHEPLPFGLHRELGGLLAFEEDHGIEITTADSSSDRQHLLGALCQPVKIENGACHIGLGKWGRLESGRVPAERPNRCRMALHGQQCKP
jgi:hypothetical protein